MREVITTVLDLLGLLLIGVAIALFIAQWTVPGSLFAAGGYVLAASIVIDYRSRPIEPDDGGEGVL